MRDLKKFDELIVENVPMVMLKSREDRGGYLDKSGINDKQMFQPVVVPVVKGGYKEKYCEEY